MTRLWLLLAHVALFSKQIFNLRLGLFALPFQGDDWARSLPGEPDKREGRGGRQVSYGDVFFNRLPVSSMGAPCSVFRGGRGGRQKM